MVTGTRLTTLIFTALVSLSAHAFTGDTPTQGDIYGEDMAENNFRADRAIADSLQFMRDHPASIIIESRSFETMSPQQIADNATVSFLLDSNHVTLPMAQYQDADLVLMDAMARAYVNAERQNENLAQFVGRLDVPTQEFTEIQKSFLNRRDLNQFFRTNGIMPPKLDAADLYIEAMRKWNLGIVD